ncbi:MAG: hypothetical protein F6J90_08385 [Moorea sp. SIOASIH]|uniref:hypothetical protein n=1 Tax=Moorena sp. SIOASIH TaxID=2607817 RepID=UPI0013BA876B|nr:hypothetical protein [Moorena sp. SIOASIH]NEO36334.1 hypothetical protein [Moorena sp. SIOASIH]
MWTQNRIRWCWHLGLVSAFCTLFSSGAIALFQNSALAQSNIVPDDTLGTAERSGVVPLDFFGLPLDIIDGGAIRGANLFHKLKTVHQTQQLP